MKRFAALAAGCFLLYSCSAEKTPYNSYELSAPGSAADLAAGAEMLMEDSEAGEYSTRSKQASGQGSADNMDSGAFSAQNTERKRIYNGSAELITENPEQTRQNIEELVTGSGGYVEQSSADYLVLRVPPEQFEEIFAAILNEGTVARSQVETLDITGEYTDISRRLQTAEQTRERLYELLRASRDPAERAKILREIGRLTEEIESYKQQLSVMDSRASYSRITVRMQARYSGSLSSQTPFDWIAKLDPLYPAGQTLRLRPDWDFGSDFAVFSREKYFMAENQNGVHILISTVPNRPRADNAFWNRALEFHYAPLFSESRPVTLSIRNQQLTGLELISKDRSAYKYFVGVIADGRNLHVFEFFAPGRDFDFDRLYESLEALK